MKNRIVEFAKNLITVPSTKNNTKELRRVLALAIKKVGNEFSREDFEKDGVPSVLFYNTKSRPKKFKIILNAHLDVVPGKDYQYKPFEKDGKLYGRGAFDMKSAAAAEILVFSDIAKQLPYPAALQIVTDEEVGGFKAAKYQVDQGIRAEFVIAGEGTNFGINNKAKGIIWANIKTKGKAAHGAYLWQGKNAIGKMNSALTSLYKQFPEPTKEEWKTTVNVARIETSNQTTNKVPEDCTAQLDIRYIPEDGSSIVDRLKKALPEDAVFEIITKESAHFSDEKNPHIALLKKIVKRVSGKNTGTIAKHGGSDVRHFTRVGNDGITFGPVGYGLHTDDEWVDIKSLEDYYTILRDFLLETTSL